MAVHAVTAVRVGADGSPHLVMWGLLDPDSKVWEFAPHAGDVTEVLETIRQGEDVFAVFTEGDEIVLGSRLHSSMGADGTEHLVSVHSARTLDDLPRF